jgi:CelD/BcsL family acetyltransferase involved in cellulose biosynthesis
MSATRLDVWPPLPPGVYARRPAPSLPYPLDEPGCSLFERARRALLHGLHELGLGPGDEVLVPAYHHGSEIEALIASGVDLAFYDAGADLAPDPDELDGLAGPRTRALYLIHYLGFPQDAPRWRRFCDERGLLLIEDAAQAWLARTGGAPVGSFGELAIYCLYKTFGVPDGAALLLAVPAAGAPTPASAGLRPLAARHAAWVLARSPALAGLAERLRPASAPYSPERDFALGEAGAPSRATRLVLPRVADADAAVRRRSNSRVLLDALGEAVPEPFRALDGASPFALPVRAADKEAMLARLASRGVHALNLWSVPHPAVPPGRFPRAAALRDGLVGLPVHQELRTTDLERIRAAAGVGRPGQRAMRVDVLDSLEAAHDAWPELAERSGNVFATWEWTSAWWRHFGRGRPLVIVRCSTAGGRPLALVPLYVWSARPLRVLRFLGHGPGDELGPVCAPEDRAAAATALRRALADPGRAWDVLIGEQLPGDARWAARLAGRVLAREGSPVLHATGWDAYLAGGSANFRQQVRRRERALARAHAVRYRLADDPQRLDADLDTLFALHEAVRGEGSQFAGPHRAFHRELAAIALARGWLRLWFLELDGRPRAAWYGFRFGGVESYYQAGRDPAWNAYSPGFVLLAHTVRAALEDGVREYRFLRGDEAFKYRFATADPGLDTVGVARGAAGAAALTGVVTLARRGPLAELRRRVAA